MQLAVLSSAILAYVFVLLIYRKRFMQVEHLERRIVSVVKIGAPVSPEVNELNKPFSERFLKPAMQGITKSLGNLLPKTESPKLAASLRLAGINMRPSEYNAAKLMGTLGMGLAGSILGMLLGNDALSALSGLLIGSAVMYVLMRYRLAALIKKRKASIQRQLPEVLDLLSVSVEAGLGFDAALQRISGHAKGPLITELDATYREITLGRPRAEALRNLEARCGLEEIKSFVSSIIQAEQLGNSLKNVLKSQAQQMRQLKRQKVEEKAMKAPVKIMIPMVMFVFPVLFIILLGPAVISIIGMKGLFGG